MELKERSICLAIIGISLTMFMTYNVKVHSYILLQNTQIIVEHIKVSFNRLPERTLLSYNTASLSNVYDVYV
jgi:hypothetical protein